MKRKNKVDIIHISHEYGYTVIKKMDTKAMVGFSDHSLFMPGGGLPRIEGCSLTFHERIMKKLHSRKRNDCL